MSRNRHEATPTGYEGRRCVVLGASGFIGHWVTRVLSEAGAEVTAVVRDASKVAGEVPAGTTVVAAAIETPAELRRALAEARPAVTFNLIGYGVRPGQSEAAIAARVNSEFPAELLSLVEADRDPTWSGNALVHVGSQAEYGPIEVLHESAAPRPDTLYGRSKLAGTLALAEASRGLSVPAVTARVFNVYGPGEPPHRLLPTIIRRAADEGPIDLTSGEQERDFTFVRDVAEGLLRLGVAGPLDGEPVNLGTGQAVAVREIVRMAAQQLHIPRTRLRYGALPDRPSEVRSQSVSVDRLLELTGWTPPTSLVEGVRLTVAASTGRTE